MTSRRISFFVPGSLEPWNGSYVHENGIGGSEECLMYLAEALAERGDEPTVYVPCRREETFRGVRYRNPTEEAIREIDSGVVVVSRFEPAIHKLIETNSKIDRLRKILWLQDARSDHFNASNLIKYDLTVYVSKWQQRELEKIYRAAPASVIIPNFILPNHFNSSSELVRHANRFVYASSPERGLLLLLAMWKSIRARIPNAELHVFYGNENLQRLADVGSEAMQVAAEQTLVELDRYSHMPDVIMRGRVNHVTLAREMQMASALLYPNRFGETFCVTAVKAKAAGCAIVTSPLAALTQTAASGITEFVALPEAAWQMNDYVMNYVNATERAMKRTKSERAMTANTAIAEYGLPNILTRWLELIG